MKLPTVVSTLIEAQNSHDSTAYANCFSENAIVKDEGQTYKGRQQIQGWITKANESYHTVMRPIGFKGDMQSGTLTSEISGNFPGSPITLQYQMKFKGERISFLTIGD